MEELILSKLDCAKRQIEVAIKLYFHFDDPVSIHTLTAAAYNILRDINKSRGNDPLLLKEWFVINMVKPEMRDEYRKLVNKAENFFKHADRDSEETHTFYPSQTEIMLWEAVEVYQRLTGEITPLLHIFRGWFMMNHLNFFTEMPKIDKEKLSLGYKQAERTKFFVDMLPLAYRNYKG
ncbi:MAG: hypothetical protein CVU54_13545 [Deltaproteobacteria bacterium HGW-Deltaproteobacteria-12]|nr:MAG: hypothetical protein CVU54_13545 [Deltaproteobacteria bacterium HGW-Deltaproteobacteria-12]